MEGFFGAAYFFLPWVWRARLSALVSRVSAASNLRLGSRRWSLSGVVCHPRRAQRGPGCRVAKRSSHRRPADGTVRSACPLSLSSDRIHGAPRRTRVRTWPQADVFVPKQLRHGCCPGRACRPPAPTVRRRPRSAAFVTQADTHLLRLPVRSALVVSVLRVQAQLSRCRRSTPVAEAGWDGGGHLRTSKGNNLDFSGTPSMLPTSTTYSRHEQPQAAASFQQEPNQNVVVASGHSSVPGCLRPHRIDNLGSRHCNRC